MRATRVCFTRTFRVFSDCPLALPACFQKPILQRQSTAWRGKAWWSEDRLRTTGAQRSWNSRLVRSEASPAHKYSALPRQVEGIGAYCQVGPEPFPVVSLPQPTGANKRKRTKPRSNTYFGRREILLQAYGSVAVSLDAICLLLLSGS